MCTHNRTNETRQLLEEGDSQAQTPLATEQKSKGCVCPGKKLVQTREKQNKLLIFTHHSIAKSKVNNHQSPHP